MLRLTIIRLQSARPPFIQLFTAFIHLTCTMLGWSCLWHITLCSSVIRTILHTYITQIGAAVTTALTFSAKNYYILYIPFSLFFCSSFVATRSKNAMLCTVLFFWFIYCIKSMHFTAALICPFSVISLMATKYWSTLARCQSFFCYENV